MALDGIILNKLTNDLKKHLPIRINRISQVSNNEVVFNVHANHKRMNLMISCHSLYNRIHFSNKDYKAYDEPSNFIIQLRKNIGNGIIENIEQVNLDRYLILSIRAIDDLYDEKHFKLYVELMGKYANIILVNEEGKIIEALKRIPPFENNKRTIWPGAKFIKPEDQNKLNPFIVDTFNNEESLTMQFAGFSPLLNREFQYRFNNQSFKEIMQEIEDSNSIYVANKKDEFEFHVIPLLHTDLKFKEYSLHEAFDYIYFELEEKERIKHITQDLFKFTKRQIKHFETKINKLNESMIEADNADILREYGDLLYMSNKLNLKGLKEIQVLDYEGKEVLIKLDEKFDVKTNANRYYNSYQKKRKSIKYLIEQLDIASNELDYFKSVSEQLAIANYNDALDIKEEMTKYGYLKQNKKAKKKQKSNKWHLYQLEFNGHLITFGKNNIQNEILTFNYAKKDYMWFHAKDFHGAHLAVDTSSPDEDTIRMCANLAAWYSNGRYSSSVPVDYCLIKDIRKIKGSKSGLVSIRNQKTIYIDPEDIHDLDIIAI